jgi:NADPH:quinone reductase-like Zn-dependent oxidoreductase
VRPKQRPSIVAAKAKLASNAAIPSWSPRVSRSHKILTAVFTVAALALAACAIVLSYEASCDPPAAAPSSSAQMKAVVSRCYGSSEVLELVEVPKPAPADHELLVRVRAAGVNPLDWHYMRGKPYLMRVESGVGRPKDSRTGVDFSGVVEAVGKNVVRFRIGDEVFGSASGAFAEYVIVREDRAVTLKPGNVTFEQAAAVPVAAITALQALRDKAKVQPGQKILINGASGGVGTFAVQIAKSMGADVTAVCSTRNVALVTALGADRVIDYTREDLTQREEKYDAIIDNVSSHSLLAYRQVLKPDGKLVVVGSIDDGAWLGPLKSLFGAMVLDPFLSQEVFGLLASQNQADLDALRDLMASSKITSLIDRRYRLDETPQAIAYVEEGHARGKVVINLE